MKTRKMSLLVVALALAFFAVAPSSAAPRAPLVIVDIAIADASPAPDPGAVRAALASGGRTPRAWLATHLEELGYTSIEEARVANFAAALRFDHAAQG